MKDFGYSTRPWHRQWGTWQHGLGRRAVGWEGNEYTAGDLLYVEPLFVWVGLQRRLSLRLILSSSGLSWGRTWAGLALQSII